jgi:hypothetical protein
MREGSNADLKVCASQTAIGRVEQQIPCWFRAAHNEFKIDGFF